MKRSLVCFLLFAAALLSSAQSVAVTDSAIQLRPTVWKLHNPGDGSQIGGAMPTNYGVSFEPVGSAGMQLFAEGPSYATMMAYTQRPLYFNQPTGIQLDFDLNVLDANGYLMESDIISTVPVPNTNPQTYTQFNMSLQDLYASGMLQDVQGSGAWTDIAGAKPGRLAVGKHHYTMKGGWNLAANTYGLTSVVIDGTAYTVTQNATGHATTWAPGISLQFQITRAPLATGSSWGNTSVIVDNIVLQQFSN